MNNVEMRHRLSVKLGHLRHGQVFSIDFTKKMLDKTELEASREGQAICETRDVLARLRGANNSKTIADECRALERELAERERRQAVSLSALKLYRAELAALQRQESELLSALQAFGGYDGSRPEPVGEYPVGVSHGLGGWWDND